jgi:TonB-linked SusC/RagA family outer membrane protein
MVLKPLCACGPAGLTKTLVIMKITAVLLFSACLGAHATGHTQSITIAEKNAPLEKVLNQIHVQSGYQFIYTVDVIQNAKPITISVRNAGLEEVLKLCFKEQLLTYSIVEKVIVIKAKPAAPKSDNPPQDEPLPPVDINGRVVNENGEPVVASILVKGTNKGVTSNDNGDFALKGVDANAVLVISGIGIETFEVKVNGRTSIVLNAKTKIRNIEEVIVKKGYYDEKKGTTTGNVGTVTAKDIDKEPINNPLLALQGRVSGIEIQQMSGLAGAPLRVRIRGYNSIQLGTDPLYIIDGVPYTSQTLYGADNGGTIMGDGRTGNPFSFINPADIESIDVLKDADATAIYGSRGANGVVLITTKSGKPGGQLKVDVNVQSGWGKVARRMKLLDTRQYLDMRYEAFKNDGAVPNPNADYDLTLWDTTRNTDWQKELIGGTARYNDAQVSVSGGNINTQYLIGMGYHKENTVFPGDFNDQKASVHMKISSSSLNKKFKVSFSGIYTVDNDKLGAFDLTTTALVLAPDAPAMYNSDGTLNWAPNASGVSTWTPYLNPAANLFSKFQSRTNNLVGNGTLGYELVPGLEIKSSFGYTNMQTSQYDAYPFAALDPSTWAVRQRSATFTNNNIQSWIIEPQVSYSTNIAKGKLSVLAGTTISQNKNNGQTLFASGFSSDLLMESLNAATSIVAGSLNTISINKYNAGFGRLNYNWQDKYLLNLAGRRDGSSRFGPASQFHNFWSVSTGWIFSKEGFIQRGLPFISFGKLRASYGTTGSDGVGDYSFLDLYNNILGIGVPYQGVAGIMPYSIYTPDLAWEETRKLEAGIELGFLKDRINLSASFYRNRSSNQLMDYPLAAITGFTSIRKNLDALLQNSGWEFELKTVNSNSKNFTWSSSFNLSINRNKLISVTPGVSARYQDLVGHSVRGFFVYHFLRVDPITGIDQFTDVNGKATFNPNFSTDFKTLVDNITKFFGGFQNSLSYKELQLDFLFQFVKTPQQAVYLYYANPGHLGFNQPASILDRWQKPGDVSSNQQFSQNSRLNDALSNARNSDQSYGDASYIRLKNVSLSWQLPRQWRKDMHLQNARVYIQGQNLLTITRYIGLDPESYNGLPPLRVITVGVQMGL